MTTFKRFTCWLPQDVGRIVPVTAESTSDSAFQATHSPAKIHRTRSGTSSAWEVVSEQDLLEAFLTQENHYTFVPILGDSGSGKSHLVRWLASRIPSTPSRRVIVVHKYQTNLRGVIEQILNGLHEHRYEEFRQKLRDSTSSLDPVEARYQLLAKLQFLIGSSNPANASLPGRQAYLSQKLPYFIGDPFIAHQLSTDGRVVARFVQEALMGRGVEDKEAPYEFAVEDLMIDFEDLEHINAAGKELYRSLLANPRLQGEAVGWLNQHLGAALRALYGISGNELSSLIYTLRRQLLAEGIELVLLVEDFAVLQGIQGELLDAVIADTDQQGERVLCAIRTAIAVTSGYFEALDTARQRASFLVNMNIETDQLGTDAQAYSSALVARYLNAIRIGESRLVSHWDSRGRHGEEGWIPNACSDCIFREGCFEAFGSTDSGYGLYPFNEASLLNLVNRVSTNTFNPRTVLRDVVSPIMIEGHREIRNGEFPSEHLLRPFHIEPLSLNDQTAVSRISESKADSGRRTRLLSLWQHEPAFRDFHTSFHEAFDLPKGLEGSSFEAKGDDGSPLPPPPPPVKEPEATPRGWSRLDAWVSRSADLSMSEARAFRNLVYRAINDAIDWEVLPFSRQYVEQKLVWDANGVRLPGDTSQGSRPLVVLRVMREDSDRLELARVLRALDILNSGGSPELADVAELAVELERWCRVVTSGIEAALRGPEGADPIAALVEIMMVGSSLCGGRLTGDGPSDALRMMLNPSLNPPPVNSPWFDVGNQYAAVHNEVRSALLSQGAISKGTGEARMLDLSRVLAAVEYAVDLVVPTATLPDVRPFESLKRKSESIFERIPLLMSEEFKRLTAVRDGLSEVGAEVADEESLASLLGNAAGDAMTANVFRPAGAHLRVKAAIEQISAGTVSSAVHMLEDALQRKGGEQLRALVAVDYHLLQGVEQDLVTIDEFLSQSVRAAEIMLDAHRQVTTGSADADALLALARIEADLSAIMSSLGSGHED